MTRETQITVPRDRVAWIARQLAQAGLTVLDTGERITTDAGVDAEAVLRVASFGGEEDTQASMQDVRLRP